MEYLLLKETFTNLLKNYTDEINLINKFWIEIENKYTSNERYYHTLEHLDNFLEQLLDIKTEFKNWESILFGLYYHDIIYDIAKSDNEQKSAEFAEKRMIKISVSGKIIEKCNDLILSTKSHKKSVYLDINYFTDADLSILGQSGNRYEQYCKNVRKEYAIYPDHLYNPGRKKILTYFLSMDRIFKTDFFFHKFEKQARYNIKNELDNILYYETLKR